MRDRIPLRVQPMLATLVPKPFDRAGWVYEEKYDGDRILAYKEGGRVRLLSRNGKDHTERLPRIAAAIAPFRPIPFCSMERSWWSIGRVCRGFSSFSRTRVTRCMPCSIAFSVMARTFAASHSLCAAASWNARSVRVRS